MSNDEDISSHNRAHYDSVTDAWAYVLGSNLHYGLFSGDTPGLDAATDRLVWEMAALARVPGAAGNSVRVLDVGCGIGNPAFLLHQRFGWNVTGITISPRGVAIGRELAEQRGCSDSVRFVEADALDNGMPAESYNLLWQMESSHLMHDKIALFKENHRVLVLGGILVLCDLFLKRDLGLVEIYDLREELTMLESAFGKAKMSTMPYYRQCLEESGFADIEVHDVSEQVKPTLAAWKENIALHRTRHENLLPPGAIDDFVTTCDILQRFFDDGVMGYGLLRAVKPGSGGA